MTKLSGSVAHLFPVGLAAIAFLAVWAVVWALDLGGSPVMGEVLSARLTWGVAAMFFAMFFAFAVVACNVLMFRCGAQSHALSASVATTTAGVVATLAAVFAFDDTYFGPPDVKGYLDATAFCVGHVKQLTAVFDGFAIWAAILVVTTSAVILAHRVTTPEALSRQLRGSKILMYCAAALLIAVVAEVGSLHKWPAHELGPANASCANDAAMALFSGTADRKASIDTTATAISTAIGTVASLILAAAYLPLGILLRQRAYRIVTPWERTETWLAIHGFALQPTQQLAKVFLIVSPLLAGGPVSYLITLLSS